VHKGLGVRPKLKFRCKIIDSNDSNEYTYSCPTEINIETGMWFERGTGYHYNGFLFHRFIDGQRHQTPFLHVSIYNLKKQQQLNRRNNMLNLWFKVQVR